MWAGRRRGENSRRRRASEPGSHEAGRNLTDAPAFEAMIARVGAELIVHGHNHVGSLAHLKGPRGPVPVIGAPSASARGGTLTHRAGYHLFTIDRDETGFLLRAELRGLKPDGSIGGLGMLSLGHLTAPLDAVQLPEDINRARHDSR